MTPWLLESSHLDFECGAPGTNRLFREMLFVFRNSFSNLGFDGSEKYLASLNEFEYRVSTVVLFYHSFGNPISSHSLQSISEAGIRSGGREGKGSGARLPRHPVRRVLAAREAASAEDNSGAGYFTAARGRSTIGADSECFMELSPEERQRIYLEEKARFEAQEKLKAAATSRKYAGCGTPVIAIILGIAVLIIVANVANLGDSGRKK